MRRVVNHTSPYPYLISHFHRCKCGHCTITHLQNTDEAWCCQELESCKDVLNDKMILEDVAARAAVLYHSTPSIQTGLFGEMGSKTSGAKYNTKMNQNEFKTKSLEMNRKQKVSV